MRTSKFLIALFGVVAISTISEAQVTVSVDANKSCMPWAMINAQNDVRIESDCAGFDPISKFYTGSCSLSLTPGTPYRLQWGGQFAYQIAVDANGLITYRAPQYVDGLELGHNQIKFVTSKVRLRTRNFPGVFGLELDTVACAEDPDETKRAKRRFVIDGARFLVVGAYTAPGESEVVQGGLFRLNADGELEKLHKPKNNPDTGSPEPFAITQDPFFTGLSPNRIIVNRAFWGYEAPGQLDE